MSANNKASWMFAKETTKGTAATLDATHGGYLFGLKTQLQNFNMFKNSVDNWGDYSVRYEKLNYGNRTFTPFTIEYEPTCPIGEYFFLGKPTAGTPNTVEINTVGSGWNPAFTTRQEDKGGDNEQLFQMEGCQAIGFKEKTLRGNEGWSKLTSLNIMWDKFSDNSASAGEGTHDRVMCGTDYQPSFIGSVKTPYLNPPVITYDIASENLDVSSYFVGIDMQQSRNIGKPRIISDVEQITSLGSYSPVNLMLVGLMPNQKHLLDYIDFTTKNWTFKYFKPDGVKYKMHTVYNVKCEEPQKIAQNDYFYTYSLMMKAEYFKTSFLLEDGITFATWFN